MANLDRTRAQRLMQEAGIEALVLLSAESFTHATGASAGVATMWRQAGAVAVLVPADASIPETAIVSDLFARSFRATSHVKDVRETPIWVETADLSNLDPEGDPQTLIAEAWSRAGRPQGFARPTTFNADACYRHLADSLVEKGLQDARIGFEAAAVSVRDHARLVACLDDFELVDATAVISRLKMVKSAEEIARLRLAVEIAETGIVAIRDHIGVGRTRQQLADAWKTAIAAHPSAAALSGSWEYVSVGPDPWGQGEPARPGDLVKVDVGCLVGGYTSDSGRTYVLGAADRRQARLFDALMQGFLAGGEMLRPGVPLSAVHARTQAAIRAAGFPGYTRGHFGHGLGASPGSEEWPFIAADSDLTFEPDMVMAFECPWYIDGVGGMIIENQILITQSGHEVMNRLPIDLVAV